MSALEASRGGGVGRFFLGLAVVLIAGVFVLTAAGLGGAWWVMRTTSAPGPSSSDVVFSVPRGAGLAGIAGRLQDAGVISQPLVFRATARALGKDRRLKAGEYRIPAGASMRDVLGLLTDGDVIQYFVTVPEGATTLAIVDILNASPILTGEVSSPPAEGSLLPETYSVTRGEARDAVIARMAAAQDTLLQRLWPERADGLPFDTVEEAVNLASIVEREAGGSEHDVVASVFVNRMRRGMRLQADATIIYGITGGAPLTNERGERRTIRRSELNDTSNPYHTYHIDGLPPTPIAHPGRAALEAVLDPPQTEYLFFVADGTGGHAFARTLREHEANRQRWRAIRRERLAEQRGGATP